MKKSVGEKGKSGEVFGQAPQTLKAEDLDRVFGGIKIGGPSRPPGCKGGGSQDNQGYGFG